LILAFCWLFSICPAKIVYFFGCNANNGHNLCSFNPAQRFGRGIGQKDGNRHDDDETFFQEFSVILEKQRLFWDAFLWKNGRNVGVWNAAGRQKWHFWSAKVTQMGGKSRTVGTQVWDF